MYTSLCRHVHNLYRCTNIYVHMCTKCTLVQNEYTFVQTKPLISALHSRFTMSLSLNSKDSERCLLKSQQFKFLRKLNRQKEGTVFAQEVSDTEYGDDISILLTMTTATSKMTNPKFKATKRFLELLEQLYIVNNLLGAIDIIFHFESAALNNLLITRC